MDFLSFPFQFYWSFFISQLTVENEELHNLLVAAQETQHQLSLEVSTLSSTSLL